MPHDANAIIGIVLCVLLVVSVVACVAAFFYELFTNTEHADAAPTRTQEANE